MPKSTVLSNDLLKLIFNSTPIANIADNASTAPLTQLYISLHTAPVAVGGTQNTNEVAYTNYARVSVARTSGGWTVTSNQAQNAALFQFPQCGASGATADIAIGTAASGAGKVLYFGSLN
jgi:hypothetical protein